MMARSAFANLSQPSRCCWMIRFTGVNSTIVDSLNIRRMIRFVYYFISVALLLVSSGPPPGVSGSKYNQRVFENVPAINFAEAERNGFRIILSDGFISRHLQPGSLPTIFVTAIPLRRRARSNNIRQQEGERDQNVEQEAEEERFTHVFYPEKRNDDKLLVRVSNLRARSWYYVCIEWENINRHNDTTGTSCKLYRTLDKFGKTTSSVISDVQLIELTQNRGRFRLRYDADFPIRLTVRLTGGPVKTPAQTFLLKGPDWAEAVFPHLESGVSYGQLCVLEEPLVTAYSAMGRLISGMTREQCYFNDSKYLTTKSLTDLPMGTEPKKPEAYKMLNEGSSAAAIGGNDIFRLTLLFVSCSVSFVFCQTS